jgi:hypothetical protein
MKRWSILIIAVISGCSLASGQYLASADQLLSSDLVQWSYMQEPQQPDSAPRQQPTPDPVPETQPTPNQIPTPQAGTPAEPEKSPQKPTAGTKTQAGSAQTFTGTISKEQDSFMLKVSETTSYKLDNQQEVQQYEGKRVKVTGTLDPAINLIHVDTIEPLS